MEAVHVSTVPAGMCLVSSVMASKV
jgi:hypothetical protein